MGLLAAVRQFQSRVMVWLPNRLRAPLSEQRRAMHFPSRIGRGYSERLQMMCNMVTSLIEHERIKTTWAKAKMVARLSDRLVTKAKRGGMANRQQASRYVKTRSSMAKLFTSKGGKAQFESSSPLAIAHASPGGRAPPAVSPQF